MLLNCGVEEDLRVPWTARRSNQSIQKEISPGYSLEGMMLKLKLQYFGHLMQRADSFEKTLMLERLRAGGAEDDRRWDGWMASLIRCMWVWVNFGCWWWSGRPGMLRFMGSQRVRHDWATELNWTEGAESDRGLTACKKIETQVPWLQGTVIFQNLNDLRRGCWASDEITALDNTLILM